MLVAGKKVYELISIEHLGDESSLVYAVDDDGFVTVTSRELTDLTLTGQGIVTGIVGEDGRVEFRRGTGYTSVDAFPSTCDADIPLRDPESVLQAYISGVVGAEGAAFECYSVAPNATDLTLVKIVNREHGTVLVGYNKNQKMVQLSAFSLATKQDGEMFVSGTNAQGSQVQYRIVSAAFGEYTKLLS